METQIDLSGLKDLHLPMKPSFWPLAYGWWLVLFGGILCVILYFLARKLWQERPVVYALKELRKIGERTQDNRAYLLAISHLLRRVSIAAFGRSKVAPLSDEKWMAFLLSAGLHCFTKEEAHLLAFAPYDTQHPLSFNKKQLEENSKAWIKKVLKKKKSS